MSHAFASTLPTQAGEAAELGIEGPHTSWRHMFWWNMLGCFCFGPMIATYRFFRTLNKIESVLNAQTHDD